MGVLRSWPASTTNWRWAVCARTIGSTMRLETRANTTVTPMTTRREIRVMDSATLRTDAHWLVRSTRATSADPSSETSAR